MCRSGGSPLACGGRRLLDNLGDERIEWRKTQVLDWPEMPHIRLRAVRSPS
ncbi:hypothetical protein [Streptomyces sp. NPDC054794]